MRLCPPFVRWCALCAVLASAACRRKAPEAAPAAQAAAGASRFCDQDLTGVWLNASDPHYAYRFRDHGGVLRGEYLERGDDGGLSNPAEPILFELHRTPEALAGVMKSTGPAPGGRTCPLEFGIKVSACEPASMTAIVETEVPITDDCRRARSSDGGEAAPALVEFRFERLAAGPDHPPVGGPRDH